MATPGGASAGAGAAVELPEPLGLPDVLEALALLPQELPPHPEALGPLDAPAAVVVAAALILLAGELLELLPHPASRRTLTDPITTIIFPLVNLMRSSVGSSAGHMPALIDPSPFAGSQSRRSTA